MRTISPIVRALCVGAGLSLGAAAHAVMAQPAQPADWPCVQRLVPKLEPGQMWSGPALETVERAGPELQQAARRMIDVKLSPEALAAEVEKFAAQQPEADRAKALGQLFALSLDWLNEDRDVVIRGINRYATSQKALADRIVAETRELERLRVEPAPDQAAITELQNAQVWDTRIYADRQRSLTLVCDQPVELEQRAFALARVIQEQLP